MDEKKLTDEEIVKAWDICNNTPSCVSECPYFNKHGKNFCMENKTLYKDIKRIVQEHAEYERKIEDGELVSRDWHDEQVLHLQNEIEYLDGCAKQFLADYQKCEIANTELQELNAKYYNEAKDLRRENAEHKAEIERLTEAGNEAVRSFTRMETLYKIKCQELEIANKKLEELKGGKID